MEIVVTCPETIFGEIVKTFDNYKDAMVWVETCLANHVKVVVENIRKP